MAKEARAAAGWSPEKIADVQGRLRLIMLATLACDESDIGATRFGMAAVAVRVEVEGSLQDRELTELQIARRPSVRIVARWRLITKVDRPSTSERLRGGASRCLLPPC